MVDKDIQFKAHPGGRIRKAGNTWLKRRHRVSIALLRGIGFSASFEKTFIPRALIRYLINSQVYK